MEHEVFLLSIIFCIHFLAGFEMVYHLQRPWEKNVNPFVRCY